MISFKEFKILLEIKNSKYSNQRDLANKTGISLGNLNSIIKELKNKKIISKKNEILTKGKKELDKYKVDNAIIMAAGMSSRFAPLSYEKPKGVLEVKGEILIERQIRQLKEAGILNITIVVGYMKEKFFYLQEKFGVKIVVNEDYYRYNNPSTLIRVLDELNNTYICSSDNYFVDNPFEKYVYFPYYSAVYFPGKTDEWGLETNKKEEITKIVHNASNMWCMLGHAYFTKEFSREFKKILIEKYDVNDTKYQLWESLYEKNIKKLKLHIRKYDADKVLEFDSIEELRSFDNKYINDSGSIIFKNISKVLKCKEQDIEDIKVMKQGLTNLSFSFSVKGRKYVYRHPGSGTKKYISRKSEAFSEKIAKELNLDRSIVYINPEEGWKISYLIEDARILDYHKQKEVQKALKMVKKLHDAKIKSKYNFDIWKKTKKLLEYTDESYKDFKDFDELKDSMSKLYKLTQKDKVEKILCHCDCYNPNFLLDKNNKMTLIDWEYSGNDDPASDLGTFICCSDYDYKQALDVLKIYYGTKATNKDIRHALAYIAIASYYWFIWALYQESIGKTVGKYIFLWYRNAKFYLDKAMKMYKQ